MPQNATVQDITTRRNGHTISTLGPQTVNTRPWGTLDHPNYQRDVLTAAIGSGSRLLEDLYQLVELQHLNPVGLALMAAGATTPQDLNGIIQIARKRPSELRTGQRLLVRRQVIHPKSALVLAHLLARGAFQGSGGDQALALTRLKTDVLLRREVDALVAETQAGLQAHRLAGFTGVYMRGMGGTDPIAGYYQRRIKSAMTQNMEIELRLVPSHDEVLNRKNAKGIIFQMIEEPVPDNKLVVVYQQGKRGSQPNDPALMMGLAVSTSSSYASSNPDAANIFRMLKTSGCGWVEIKPDVARLPLARLESQVLFWRKTHLIRPPEGESPGLRIVLGKVLELVSQNPEAFHMVAVAGSFHGAEQELLREAIVSMIPGGRVVPLIATMNTRVEGNVTECLIADLVSAPQLPKVVTSVFSDQGVLFPRDGVTPAEFLATVKEPEEVKVAREIDEALDWIVGAGR